MDNREKVISHLQIIRTWAAVGPSIDGKCLEDTVAWIDDALALLKAQEPVEPTWRRGRPFCGNCGIEIYQSKMIGHVNFCQSCGMAVKWELAL